MIRKPVHVMFEEGLTVNQHWVVFSAIKELLQIARVEERISIINLGIWRMSGWLHNSKLTDWYSIDWYLAMAKKASARNNQINAGRFLDLLELEPWQDSNPHFDVAVIKSDMYAGESSFCIGLARKEVATIISINRFLSLPPKEMLECIKTETIHEIGHVFGLVPEARTNNVEESLGKHCTNRCVMRQGLRLPVDWQRITRDRLQYGSLCGICQKDLQNFFR